MQLPVWNLKDILNPKDIDRIIAEIRDRVDALAKQQKRFSPKISTTAFKRIMDELERINRASEQLGAYANNRFNENSKDQAASTLLNRVVALGAEIDTKLLFISQRFKEFPEQEARRLIAACPEYAHHLKKTREYRKHTLTDAEERIITQKDINGSNALSQIFDIITTGFTFTLGNKEVGMAELTKRFRDPDPKRRKEAYLALLTKFEANKDTLGAIYQHIVDDWGREAKLRKHPTPISVRNKRNELSDAAVATLLKVCTKNSKIFQGYFKKKAKMLGMKKLRRFDLYAPMTKKEQRISYAEAQRLILDAFEKFGDAFMEGAKEIIDRNHIHARIQPNKYTGAYCTYPSPEITPYILLNYNDTITSVRTMAHELGHGVHGVLARQQNMFNHHATLPVCETASTFAEMLLSDHIKRAKPALARDLTMAQLDELYATIGRQSWFVQFEIAAHEKVAQHTSVDELSQLYLTQLKQQFGDSLILDDKYRYEWLLIPHIYHTPFYCYAYSFGALLSLSLYAQWKQDPKFSQKIIAFLAKGGSESPEQQVKATGFDLTDEKFWQSGFDVIKRMIKELR